MNNLLSLLASYIPPPLLRHLISTSDISSASSIQHFTGAVLFADVSGFTPLTESLAQHGTRGSEELSRLMSTYFDQMISLVMAEGGEVVSFSGDALTILFSATDEPLSYAIRRAYQAARTMQNAMTTLGTLSTSIGNIVLGMKICIGAGHLTALQVGGVLGRWEYTLTGAPITQIAIAERYVSRGDVVLSSEAQTLLHPDNIPSRSVVPIVGAEITNPEELADVLRRYIPRAVETGLHSGTHAWLAELRPLSVLFIGVQGIDYIQTTDVDKLHHLVRTIQTNVYRYEGSLAQVVVDDKGTVILVLFGAPPLAHEDDAQRAVSCALDLRQSAMSGTLHTMNVELTIGIATGRVFIGPVGSDLRRTYAVMGDTVNLAARLMSHTATGDILCDTTTYQQSHGHFRYDALPPIQLKGKADLVPIFQPRAKVMSHNIHSNDTQVGSSLSRLVGRQHEFSQLRMMLDQVQEGQSETLIIEGEAGIGKSHLVHELVQVARQRTLKLLFGTGQNVEQHTPYRAWRDVFAAYFGFTGLASPQDCKAQVQSVMQHMDIQQIERMPLLNDILNVSFREPPPITTLDPSLRHQSLMLLLTELLHYEAQRQPLLIVLEDAQWFDSLSWELVVQLVRSLQLVDIALLCVVVTRPLEVNTPGHQSISTLQALSDTHTLYLDALSTTHIRDFTAATLGVETKTLPSELTDLVCQYADGNPFIAQELVFMLRDQGSIHISREEKVTGLATHIAFGHVHGIREHLPTTVQGLILARLDRLLSGEQFTLKVASVIGHIFQHVVLQPTLQAYTDINKEALQEHLRHLIELDVISDYMGETDMTYTFRHIMLQEVTYQTLLFAQRRTLHRFIAAWYEMEYADQEALLSSYYPLLVHHYHYADEQKQECHYAMLAGRWAAARYANAEAITYLSRALELIDANRVEEYYTLLLDRERVYDRLGQRDEQQTDLASLSALVDHLVQPNKQAEIALRYANYGIVTGDYPNAISQTQRTIELLEHTSEYHLLTQAYLVWGRILRFQANYQAAQRQLHQALSLSQTHGLLALEADSLRQLGAVAFFQDHYVDALDFDQQALVILQQLGDRQGEARTLDSLGCDASEQGDYTSAMAYFEQALQLFQQVGDQWGLCLSLGNLGQVCREQGYYSRALETYAQGISVCKAIGDVRTEGWFLGSLGWLYLDLGDYFHAKQFFGEGVRICQSVGNQSDEWWILSGIALLHHLQGDNVVARDGSQHVLQMAQQSGERSREGDSWLCLGHAFAGLGQLEDSSAAYHQSFEIWQDVGQPHRLLEAQAGLAAVYSAQQNRTQALIQVDRILEQLATQSLSGSDEPMRVYWTCYQILHDQQDPRALLTLRIAYEQLLERANTITDMQLRQTYLEQVTVNRMIIAAWAAATAA